MMTTRLLRTIAYQRTNKAFLMVGVFLFFCFSIIRPVQAQIPERTCECFCATEQGVKPPGDSLQSMSVRDCQTACTNKGDKVAVCAFDISQYPSRNVNCFTAGDCQKAVDLYCSGGGDDSTVSCKPGSRDDTFDTYQPPECLPGEHYCYPPKLSTNVRLNIQVEDTVFVDGLEKYIGILYQWMIGAGVIFAIVLVMVGGFQYVLGAAASSQVAQGKTRIRNAVTGLVLLISAVLIVETVSPRLTQVSVPRLPLIKTVEIAGSGKSCELLANQEHFVVGTKVPGKEDAFELYKENTKSPGCGTVAAVVSGPNDADVPVGMTCDFKTCQREQETGLEREICLGSGNRAKCLPCKQVYDGSPALEGTNVVPSSSICGRFTQGVVKEENGLPLEIQMCGWTKETIYSHAGITNGGCVDIRMDCNDVRAKGCESYKQVPTYGRSGQVNLHAADSEPDDTLCVGPCSDFSWRTICRENPCKIPSGCYVPDVGYDSCEPARTITPD